MSQVADLPLDARTEGRQAVQDSIPTEVWQQNAAFVDDLKQLIAEHRVSRHPLIEAMNGGQFDLDKIRQFHLEANYAFVEIFTDSLLHGMVAADQLAERYGIPAKMAARFLLQINIMDELGFVGGGDDAEAYAGTPYDAHFMKFQGVMRELGDYPGGREAIPPQPGGRRVPPNVHRDVWQLHRHDTRLSPFGKCLPGLRHLLVAQHGNVVGDRRIGRIPRRPRGPR